MSKVASVTFAFDGSRGSFERICHAVCDVVLDIAAYSEGITGTIEFSIGDFEEFRRDVARRSEEMVIRLVAFDYLISERRL